MEELQLSEPEQRYFGDLFLLCSNGETSVPIVKACELFRTSKLPNEVIRQVSNGIGPVSGSLMGTDASTYGLHEEFLFTLSRLLNALMLLTSVSANTALDI